MTAEQIFDIRPFEWPAIGTALLCGVLIGLERQLRGKPVGIRTASLIVFGTYVYMAVSLAVNTSASDPTRIIGQIVTGVGFLGAGVMLTKDGVVLGVTSAATIWALAAIGVCVAIADKAVTLKLTCVMLFILWGVEMLESYSSSLTRGVHSQYLRIAKGEKNASLSGNAKPASRPDIRRHEPKEGRHED